VERQEASYHHGDLRRALLGAAAQVVAGQGVAGLSLRAVARRAGVSHAAPAHHFADKAALLGALVAEGHQELARSIERSLQSAGPGPRARLAALARGSFRFATRRPELFRIMFRPELVEPTDPILRASVAASDQHLRGVVAECVAAGMLEAARAEAFQLGASALIHGLSAAWIDAEPARRRAIRRTCDESVELLLGVALGGASTDGA
jgi:AcrR family transcriptional regulator